VFPDNLVAQVEGEIVKSGQTLKIAKIRVHYQCKVPKVNEEAAMRAFEFHPQACPAYQSVKESIDIELDVHFEFVD
jgi:uncharacterized OsmC-like protein